MCMLTREGVNEKMYIINGIFYFLMENCIKYIWRLLIRNIE